jgi:hypothetical protein
LGIDQTLRVSKLQFNVERDGKYFCQECGHQVASWGADCPSCRQIDALREIADEAAARDRKNEVASIIHQAQQQMDNRQKVSAARTTRLFGDLIMIMQTAGQSDARADILKALIKHDASQGEDGDYIRFLNGYYIPQQISQFTIANPDKAESIKMLKGIIDTYAEHAKKKYDAEKSALKVESDARKAAEKTAQDAMSKQYKLSTDTHGCLECKYVGIMGVIADGRPEAHSVLLWVSACVGVIGFWLPIMFVPAIALWLIAMFAFKERHAWICPKCNTIRED